MIPEGYNLKRFLCLLLCAMLICTLCACGKSDKPDAVSVTPSAAAVAGPTFPSIVSPFRRWNSLTASLVFSPYSPSAVPDR